MASYLIGYDLNKRGKDYSSLIEAIKKVGSDWWHCLDSTWIVKHDGPSTVIRDALAKFIDSDDELLVVRLTGEGAWRGFNDECSSWLTRNL
ncbi:hypothetical protein DFR29_12082 [Tahibacter aquaticus]|uniref:SinR family protein n=1 Tax=Tahibacter aquaticus TaxID=520092 RepID=A0A4R6YMF2_9GAMM|nr:SinR family protein [Tahibacter aquaticus]TDR38581.1 hypothetical protein DFR29_12082 [Tahibacter aquaticus]